MYSPNDLKYFVISDAGEKFMEMNQKIVKFTKLYYYTIKNHSYQIVQIENKINEYNIKGKVKIKELLESQQQIIRELINLINNMLQEKRGNGIVKKIEPKKIKNGNKDFFPLKQKKGQDILNYVDMSNYVESKDDHQTKKCENEKKENFAEIKDNGIGNGKTFCLNETKNHYMSGSVDEKNPPKIVLNQKKFVGLNTLSNNPGLKLNSPLLSLNINPLKQKNNKTIIRKFINKEKEKVIKTEKHSLYKSMSLSKIPHKWKINNKSIPCLKTSNISNSKSINELYRNKNHSMEDEKRDLTEGVSLNEGRQNSIGSSNKNDNNGSIPHLLTKRKKRIKYRVEGRIEKPLLTEKNKDFKAKRMAKSQSAKEMPIKTECTQNYNSSFRNFTLTTSSVTGELPYCNRSNSVVCFYNGTLDNLIIENNKSVRRIESEICSIPYINNCKTIIPSRYTKEVLNRSYRILNNYEKKKLNNY